MITETLIQQKFKEYRQLIGRETSDRPSGVTYSHFKAAYLMALGIDLVSNGFTATNWEGSVIEGVVAGEDLL